MSIIRNAKEVVRAERILAPGDSAGENALAVFWHHVGREHAANGDYAPDLRKNSLEVVDAYLSMKLRGARASARAGTGNLFVKASDNVVLELPREMLGAVEKPAASNAFVICYLIAEGLQLSFGNKPSHPGWLIDVVNITEVEPNLFCAADLFVDIQVALDGKSYRVLDMEDISFAMTATIIDTATLAKALASLSLALDWLNGNPEDCIGFPPETIRALLAKYTPGLSIT